MAKLVNVVANQDEDERVLQILGSMLRRNDAISRQLRDFANSADENPPARGLQFQPRAGDILVCSFGVGFQVPENVKTRPVLVVSPHQKQWSGLCLVLPISSKIPKVVRPYHYKLPDGIIPNGKYAESWIKGDMLIAVGCHRLDRFRKSKREYVVPKVSEEILREARRCILHVTGMHSLTEHW